MINVIIPAYNCSKTLGRTLASLVAQTDTDFEVTVVDDCSTEDIKTIVDGYKDKLNIIKINGIFLVDEKYQKVVNIYSSLLKENKDVDILYKELESVCPNISKGFLLNKSVLLKKD